MAQRVTESISEKVDRLLQQVNSSWEELPEVAAKIDTWDLVTQLDFTEEWPLVTDKMKRLESLRDSFTPEQQERYDKLQKLIERNKAVLKTIMEKQ